MASRSVRIIVASVGLTMLALFALTWWYWGYVVNPPIQFYGRVVDDLGSPLPGVSVDLEIRRLAFMSLGAPGLASGRQTKEVVQVVTDTNGDFAVTTRHGVSVLVARFRRPGFTAKFTGLPTAFAYDQRRDPGNPLPSRREWRITYPLMKTD